MDNDDAVQQAKADALRLLSYRPRSETELRARLARRFPAQVVQQVIAVLVEQDLVDDASFAQVWTSSRDSTNPRSASAIRRELRSKGVSRDVAAAATSGVDDQDGAYRAGLKLARRLEGADFPTFRRKLWGYLQRRGFSPALTRQTVARLWEERKEAPPGPSDAGGKDRPALS